MKYLIILFCLVSFGANAQLPITPDSCGQFQITAGTDTVIMSYPMPFVFTNSPYTLAPNYFYYPTHTIPKKQQPKINLWANTQLFGLRGYQVNNLKLAGWSALALAGMIDGITEGYEFDGRRSFERKWSVDKLGYFGSESWRRAYKNNDPEQGYKNLYTRTLGANDAYHTGDDLRKFGYVSGAITVGMSGAKTNAKWWHHAIDFGVGLAVSGASKAAGMYWIRN